MDGHYKKRIPVWLMLITNIFICISCSTTRSVTPQVALKTVALKKLPVNGTKVIVNDYRIGAHTDNICASIQTQLMQALSRDANIEKNNYVLTVDVIFYQSFYTFINWHGEIKLKVVLTTGSNEVIGRWDIDEKTAQANMWGYLTAKQVAQEAYEKAISHLIAAINAVP